MANSKNVPLAIEAYSQALKLVPDHRRALRARAVVYVFDDQYDAGIADLTRLMALLPRDDDPAAVRAEVYARKGAFLRKRGKTDGVKAAYEAAAADIRTAMQRNPAEPDHWIPLCDYLYHAGRYPEAAALAKKGLANDTAQTRPRMVLAFISARSGDLEAAKKAYADAKANGVTTDQRREGLREMAYALKEHPNSPAIRGLIELLTGPEELTPADW